MNRFNPYGTRPKAAGSGYGPFSDRGFGPPGSSVLYGVPPAPSQQQDSEVCAAHGKRRTSKNLVKNDDGNWVCTTGNECKVQTVIAANPVIDAGGNATCALHGKNRTVANLEQNGEGNWVCIRSSRCKNGKTGGFGPSFNQSIYQNQMGGYGIFHGPQHGGWMAMNAFGGGLLCSVHGKKRTMQNLVRNQMGAMVCVPGNRCKMMAGQQLLNGKEIEFCSVHGKQRSVTNMEQGENGEWVCTEKYQCKVVPEGAKSSGEQMCTLHNKSRSTPNLQQNESGEWVCIDSSRCK